MKWEWDESVDAWIAQLEEGGQMLTAHIEDTASTVLVHEWTPTVELHEWTRTSGWSNSDAFILDREETVEAAKQAVEDWIDAGSPLW